MENTIALKDLLKCRKEEAQIEKRNYPCIEEW